MRALGRFLLRFILVPLGIVLAVLVATIVALIGHWDKFAGWISNDPHATGSFWLNVLLLGPTVLILFSVGAIIMLMPAILSVLASEIFALRSWIFHAVSGGFWMWIGWLISEDFRKPYEIFNESWLVVIAGVAAGLTYWGIAGRSAGFWKPMLRSTPPLPPAPPADSPPPAPA